MRIVTAEHLCDRCGDLMPGEPTMLLALRARNIQEIKFELCQPCMDRLWTEFLDPKGIRTAVIQARTPGWKTPEVFEKL